MDSFINCTGYQILLELKTKGRKVTGLVMQNECDMSMCTTLSEIPSHNEQSTLLLGSYMYTKLQTQ